MGSVFERLSDEQLNRYMKYFNTVVTNKFRDMDDFYQNIMYDDKLPKKIGAPVGIRDIQNLDLEYIYYILDNNPEGGPYLRRPKLSEVSVDWVTEEKVKITYTRTGDIETYIPDSIDSSYLYTLKSDDYINPWEWDITNEDSYDSDIYDDYFDV
jgi:hypothetical protein